MQKQIKKDNTLFRNIFLLCGVILILGISSFVNNYQQTKTIRKLQIENYNITLQKTHLESENKLLEDKLKLSDEMSEVNELITDLYSTENEELKRILVDSIMPYGAGLEYLYIDYNILTKSMIEMSSQYIPDSYYGVFLYRISEMENRWDNLQDSIQPEIDYMIESGLFY